MHLNPVDRPLLAVPNVSEGRDRSVLDTIGAAFGARGARILDVHADPDHHRSVFSLAGAPGDLAEAVAVGVAAAIDQIDVSRHRGEHPRVGAVDVAPIVYPDVAQRGAACAEALVLADLLGTDLGVPVFLYGDLGDGRTRADLRRGGLQALSRRIECRELHPDAGPRALHPRAGAVLVAARAPLVAFNVELEPPATLQTAKDIAARIRDGGADGLPGVRAIGLRLGQQDRIQVSTNIEDVERTTPAGVLAAVARYARVREAELVGLAPDGAFADFPPDVPLRGYDPATKDIARALAGG